MMKRILVSALALILITACGGVYAKQADLAGSWYNSSPSVLKNEIDGYLDDAHVGDLGGRVVGVIVPHAGLRFSGPIAAYSYKAAAKEKPEKVILVGFTHREHFPNTISILTDESFVTPLGAVRIDEELTEKFLSYNKNIKYVPQAFSSENSIELQIPFIQETLKGAELVVLVLCDQGHENSRLAADALYDVLKDEENFVMVASADMSHHMPYEIAKTTDARTIKAIETFDPEIYYRKSMKDRDDERMCGCGAVYAVMDASRRLGADKVKVLKYANSGDTYGAKDAVVGYMSAAFIRSQDASESDTPKKEEGDMLNQAQREELLKIARDTISHYLETGKRLDVSTDDEELKQDMGAFVTLHERGQLRGCIGHMVATGPLYLTVRDMAIAAATEDPRFPPVKLSELKDIDIEISALSPMERIEDYNDIEMGRHGVMVRQGWKSGVYLPQVADETGWDRDQFMSSLCAQKAGLSPNAWRTGDAELYVFTAEVFGEKESE